MTTSQYGHVKPLDFGVAGVTGSIDSGGRIIALNTYDETHGYITLTSAYPFPDGDRYDAQKVRAYRRALAAMSGAGVVFDAPISRRELGFWDVTLPKIRLWFDNGGYAEVLTWAMAKSALQRWTFAGVTPRFQGRVSLQRCAYTQLTEGGVIPAPPADITLAISDSALTVENAALGRAVAIYGLSPHESHTMTASGPVYLDAAMPDAPPVQHDDFEAEMSELTLYYHFGTTAADALESVHALRANPSRIGSWRSSNRRIWQGIISGDLLAQRGLIYGDQMCVPVGEGMCILTDHMLLPLSWNRDSYFVATALMHGVQHGTDIVRRHLIWLFEIAERPNGDWGRCYLANGKVKDRAYQLDQQIYPVLELADYTALTGDTSLLERLKPQVRAVLDALERHRDDRYALYATDETPGDDPIAQPYHLSSHILLWRMLTRWAAVAGDAEAAELAAQVQAAVDAHFVVPISRGRSMYAYAVDARGGHHLYYDANDMPTALAPAWGFCPPTSPVWRNTVDFAFSPDNPGTFDERLGSVHTPAPWALGDLQDVIVSRTLKDPAREMRAWRRLRTGAGIDGALPEAYDAATGEVVSRTWFAWPNAVAACLQRGVWDTSSAEHDEW